MAMSSAPGGTAWLSPSGSQSPPWSPKDLQQSLLSVTIPSLSELPRAQAMQAGLAARFSFGRRYGSFPKRSVRVLSLQRFGASVVS